VRGFAGGVSVRLLFAENQCPATRFRRCEFDSQSVANRVDKKMGLQLRAFLLPLNHASLRLTLRICASCLCVGTPNSLDQSQSVSEEENSLCPTGCHLLGLRLRALRFRGSTPRIRVNRAIRFGSW
jgi:hypothetical protein